MLEYLLKVPIEILFMIAFVEILLLAGLCFALYRQNREIEEGVVTPMYGQSRNMQPVPLPLIVQNFNTLQAPQPQAHERRRKFDPIYLAHPWE